MNNKLIILTPAYKVGRWVELYVSILKHQTYRNFEVYFIDDNSPNNTEVKFKQAVGGDSRFFYFKNERRIGSPLANIAKAFDLANPQDEDVIVNIDGDDWLSSVFVLEYINTVYDKTGCWLTFGTCQTYPGGDIAGHAQIPLPPEISDTNSYKKYPFIASHLRTYKAGLFRRIDRQDFIDHRTDRTYTESSDLALMFPMLEMSGKDRIYRIEGITYILNRENELNEATINVAAQKETETIIRNTQKVYERIYHL